MVEMQLVSLLRFHNGENNDENGNWKAILYTYRLY